MTYTNSQAKELLNERFTNSQITEAFEEMARRGVKITPKDAHFEDEVIHTMVAILEAGDRAIKEQKSLPQTSVDAETFVGGAIQRAQSELTAQNIDPQLVNGMIRVVFRETIAQAVAIAQIRKDLFKNVLAQTSTEFLQDFATESAADTQFLASLANNPEAKKRILASYGINGGVKQAEQFSVQALEQDSVIRAKVAQFFGEAEQLRQETEMNFPETAMDKLMKDLGIS